MATQAKAYLSSGELKSAKFAPPPPRPLLLKIEASRLPARYRSSLKYFVLASHYGPDLFASTFKASFMRGVSYRTMQRHIDWLERQKVLKKKHPANEFFIPGKGIRRTATYVLHEDAPRLLSPRESYDEWAHRNRRFAPPRKRAQRATQKAPAAASIVPVLVAEPENRPHTISRGEDRAQKLRQALGKRVAQLMHGVDEYTEKHSGLAIKIGPGHADYRRRLSQSEAVAAAAAELGLAPAEAAEHLKLMGWKFATEENRE